MHGVYSKPKGVEGDKGKIGRGERGEKGGRWGPGTSVQAAVGGRGGSQTVWAKQPGNKRE